MRGYFLLPALLLMLSACGGSGDDSTYTPPAPNKIESNLHVFDLYGNSGKVIFIKSVSTNITIDTEGITSYAPQETSLSSRIYAGENTVGGVSCDLFGCYVQGGDTVVDIMYVNLQGPKYYIGEYYLGEFYEFGDSVGMLIDAEGSNGGVSEVFLVNIENYKLGDIGTAEVELFNMDGPSGNGFKEATMMTVESIATDGTQYIWANTIGTEPWIDSGRADKVDFVGEFRGIYVFESTGTTSNIHKDVFLELDFSSLALSGEITGGNFNDDIILLPSNVSPEDPLVLIGQAFSPAVTSGEPHRMTGDYVATVFGGGSEVGGSVVLTGSGLGVTGAFVAAE